MIKSCPILTKSITSALIYTVADFSSQVVALVDFDAELKRVTRLIPDAIGTTCNQRLERVSRIEYTHILRVPFRTENGILRKWISRFDVWPYLEKFTKNPAIRRKVFYPNRQNPTFYLVQILKEEKAMRPFDDGCPSCLFLCIKYGGRTRNLTQNEYVRQRIGRNKLKSFGPVICRMAMLVHIRSGSFFFKALGITLLFMAGFPDDLVQKETKYRNVDLLQKYYRTDEDAVGRNYFFDHQLR